MKRLFFLVAILVVFGAAHSQPSYNWVIGAGGLDLDNNYSITTDSNGNSYVAGSYTASATFGTASLVSLGETDIFIAKLDSNGNWLWAVSAGGSLADNAYGIAADLDGNVYVTGFFYGTANFGTTLLSVNGGSWSDIFAAKLDTNGNWLWAKRAGGTNFDVGYSIVADPEGNCYLTGQFYYTADFGSSSISSSGSNDAFVAKLDTNGNWLWAVHGGSTGNDLGQSLTTDLNGNIILTGYYSNNALFGTTSLSSNGNRDILVAKLDQNGNWLWAKGAGGTVWDMGQSVSADGSGSIYVTGYFKNSVVFGNSTVSSGSDYNQDIFIAKLDANGNWLWGVSAGGTTIDNGYGIVANLYGFVYVTGSFDVAAYFGSSYLSSAGNSDIFVAGLDTNGNWLWVRTAGGVAADMGRSLALDADGNLRISGDYRLSSSFGDMTLNSVGDADIFVTKLSVPGLPLLTLPFLEDWSSGSLYTNFWTADSENWHIDDNVGNPAPAVVFTGEAGMVSYEYTLTSHEIDGTGVDSVLLKFYLELSISDGYGGNYISVEVWDGSTWNEIHTYNEYDLYDPQFGIFDITSIAAGNIFKVRFKVFGYDGSYINYWLIDNIMLKQIPSSLPVPQNFSLYAVGTDAFLSWNAVPDADWYAVYASDDPSAVFEYGGWIDSSITSVSIPLMYFWLPRMFYKLTAGSGAPPEFRSTEGHPLFPVLRSGQE